MAVHPLRPATDRRLGEPLPHQLANQTRVHLIPIQSLAVPSCEETVLCGISSRFQLLSPCIRQVTHALLTRPPLSHFESKLSKCFVRLACVKHAASVHPEPGSNSQIKSLILVKKSTSFMTNQRFVIPRQSSFIRCKHLLTDSLFREY